MMFNMAFEYYSTYVSTYEREYVVFNERNVV